MHVDFKITTWERVEVSDGSENKVMQLLESGQINNSDELINMPSDIANYEGHITNTDSILSYEENGNCETIEAFDDNGNVIWSNTPDTKPERTLTLTLKEVAQLASFGSITTMLLAKKEGALDSKIRENMTNGFITDFSKMSDETIKSLLPDLYKQLEIAKKQAYEQKK